MVNGWRLLDYKKNNNMNTFDRQYLDLLNDILNNGVEKNTRNGKVLSVFGKQIRHNMQEGFPLLTTKKMAWKQIVVELLWFLRGDTNIKYLVDNDCHIWDDNVLKVYHKHEMDEFKKLKEKYPNRRYKFALIKKEEFINKIKTDPEFAKTWGDLGSVYGKQWRRWGKNGKLRMKDKKGNSFYEEIKQIDQIQNLINDLKTDPDSRRLLVSAWAVHDLPNMALPPCHYGFQVYTRELSLAERCELMKKLDNWVSVHYKEPKTMEYMDSKNIPKRAISLMWNQRSVDVPLGLPFNIASYGLLLIMLADEVNMVPEELIGNLGDTHIYLNQIDGVKEQLTREPLDLPTVIVQDGMYCSSINDVILENYKSHPKINFPFSV